jgi:hypothetical protein
MTGLLGMQDDCVMALLLANIAVKQSGPGDIVILPEKKWKQHK